MAVWDKLRVTGIVTYLRHPRLVPNIPYKAKSEELEGPRISDSRPTHRSHLNDYTAIQKFLVAPSYWRTLQQLLQLLSYWHQILDTQRFKRPGHAKRYGTRQRVFQGYSYLR